MLLSVKLIGATKKHVRHLPVAHRQRAPTLRGNTRTRSTPSRASRTVFVRGDSSAATGAVARMVSTITVATGADTVTMSALPLYSTVNRSEDELRADYTDRTRCGSSSCLRSSGCASRRQKRPWSRYGPISIPTGTIFSTSPSRLKYISIIFGNRSRPCGGSVSL